MTRDELELAGRKPTCRNCRKALALADIRGFQANGGEGLPRVCAACAESLEPLSIEQPLVAVPPIRRRKGAK